MKLSELEEGTHVTLLISNKDRTVDLTAAIKKHIKNNIAMISLGYDSKKKLVFDKVQIDMEFYQDGEIPIIWHNVKVMSYQDDYVVQVFSEGTRHNRRGFFRVGVSTLAQIRTVGLGVREIMVRDISLSGFSVSDRKKQLKLNIGDELSVFFEDFGHKITLTGNVIRKEELEDMYIYGLKISNLCNDLSSYISVKQRQKR